jgi:hypothetical protein
MTDGTLPTMAADVHPGLLAAPGSRLELVEKAEQAASLHDTTNTLLTPLAELCEKDTKGRPLGRTASDG